MVLKVRAYTLNLLARREHTKAELERKLSAKGFTASEIKETLESFAAKDLQSDGRFAESYINMRSRGGFGPVRIKLELRERGIDKEIIDEFLIINDSFWFELAKVTRVKKFGEEIPKDLKEKARQMKYLNYRGFTGDQIKDSLASYPHVLSGDPEELLWFSKT